MAHAWTASKVAPQDNKKTKEVCYLYTLNIFWVQLKTICLHLVQSKQV